MSRKLSIILPLYNVERYVEKCILSLQQQDLSADEYEIIAINDGSPDGSRAVVMSLMERYQNIVLIDQVNQGVSVARNNGLRRATGKYVLFVDPDDFVEENCLGGLLGEMESSGELDLVMVGLREVQLDGETTFINTAAQSGANLTGIELYRGYRSARGETGVDSSCGIVIRRALIANNDLYFLENVPYLEDGEFIARVFCMARRAAYFAQPCYNRLIRPGSATNSDLYYREYAVEGFIKAARNLKSFRDNRQLALQQQEFLNQPIVKFVMLSVQACSRNIALFEIVKRRLKEEGLLKVDLSGCDDFYSRYGSYFNRSVNLFYIAWLLRLVHLSARSKMKRFIKTRSR